MSRPRPRARLAQLLALGTALLSLGGCASPTALTTPGPTLTPASPDALSPGLVACRAADLRLRVVAQGALMSQPFVDVLVTHDVEGRCLLRGYPRIRAFGHSGWSDSAPTHPMTVHVRPGVYERTDPGPHDVVLGPRDDAVFSVGTATAYQGGAHIVTLTRLSLRLQGAGGRLVLRLDLPASRPAGSPIPVGVTALRRAASAR